MSKHIRVENGQVVECVDVIPNGSTGDWREAIEIPPTLIPGRQIMGAHSFDLTKNPAEIVWSVIDLNVAERKSGLLNNLNAVSYTLVHDELIKEFNGQDSDFNLVQAAINIYRQKRAEIFSLQTHEEIDTFAASNQ